MDIRVFINSMLRAELGNRVLSFEIIDNMDTTIDSLILSIDNSDLNFDLPSNREAKIELVVDNIRMGEFNIEFVEANSSVITIKALGQDLELGRVRYSRVFKNKTLKDVLQTLATSLDLSLNMDILLSTRHVAYLLQDNKTNLETLRELGEIYYAIANIKDGELVFVTKDKIQLPIVIAGDKEIIGISKNDNVEFQAFNGVRAMYWDFKKAQQEELILGEKPYLEITSRYEESLIKELVISKNKEIKNKEIISAILNGNSDLQAGFDIMLVNLSVYKDFVGRYKIAQAKHIFDGSFYTTEILASKSA